MRVFVAGPGEHRRRVREEAILPIQRAGYSVFDWTTHPLWDVDRKLTMAEQRQVADEDRLEVCRAEALVWWLIGEPSPGASYEAGLAAGRGIPVIIVPQPGSNPDRLLYSAQHVISENFDHALFILYCIAGGLRED